MDQLPGILHSLIPYLYFLWFIPIALIGYYLGWRVRGIEVNSSSLNFQDEIKSRELKLRAMQSKLNRTEIELIDHDQQARQTIATLKQEIESANPDAAHLQASIDQYRARVEELNAEKAALLRQQASAMPGIRSGLANNQHQTAFAEADRYREKFKGLQTKYRQMDARRSLEIVEHKADIVELKKRLITRDKDFQTHTREVGQHQSEINALVQARKGHEVGYNSVKGQLGEAEKNIAALEKKLRDQHDKSSTEIAVLNEKLKSVGELSTRLNEKTSHYQRAVKELAAERRQTLALTEKFDQATDQKRSELAQFEKTIAALEATIKDQQNHSTASLESANERINTLKPLETVTKNQQRTIEKLENKLADHTKQTSALQTLETQHISAKAEIEKLQLNLNSSQEDFKKQQSELNRVSDKLQQTEFENKKIANLQTQLTEKTTALTQRTAKAKEQDHLLTSRTRLLDAEKTKVAKLHKELLELSVLNDKISDRDDKIQKLEVQQDLLRKKSQDAEANQHKIAGLMAEIERSKSATETHQKAVVSHKETESRLREEIEANLKQNHQIKDLEQQLAGQKQVIGQLNRTLADQRAKTEKLTTNDKELQIVQSQFQKVRDSDRSAKAEIIGLNAELANLSKYKEKSDKAATTLKETTAALEHVQNSFEKTKSENSELTVKYERQLDDLKNQNAKKQDKLATTADKLKELETRQATLQADNDQLRSKFARVETELAKSAEHASQAQKLKDEKTSLQTELESLNKQIGPLRHKQETLAAENMQIPSLQSSLKKKENEATELRSTVDELKHQHKRQLAEHSNKIEAQAELESKQLNLVAKLESSEHDFNDAKKKVSELDSQLTSTRIKLAEEQSNAAKIKAELSREHKRELEATIFSNNQLLSKSLADTEAELEAAHKAELMRVRNELESEQKRATKGYEDKLSAVAEQITAVEENSTKQLEENRKSKELTANLKQQLESASVLALEKSRKDTDAIVAKLQSEHSEKLQTALKERDNSHSLQMDKLSDQIKSNEAKLQALRDTKQHLEDSEAKITELEKSLADQQRALAETVKTKSTELNESRAELSNTTQQVETLELRIKELEAIEKTLASNQAEQLTQAKRIATLEEQITAAQKRLQETESRAQASEQALKNASSNNQTQTEKTKELDKSNQKLLSELASLKESVVFNQQSFKDLTAKNASQSALVQQLTDKNSVLEATSSQLKMIEADVAEQEFELERLRKVEKEFVQYKQASSEKIELQTQALRESQTQTDQDSERKVQALQEELRKARKAANSSTDYLDEISKLKKENKRFRILEASVQDRQTDIDRLQREINRLASIEQSSKNKDAEIRQLKKVQSQLKDRDTKIAELHATLESSERDRSEQQGDHVDLKRLRSQVQSLTKERDLGLERVRELSELTTQLSDRDKLIKELKSDIADERVNIRELDTLRQRIQQNETEIKQKNDAIDDLKRMLQRADVPSSAKTLSSVSPTRSHTSTAPTPSITVTKTRQKKDRVAESTVAQKRMPVSSSDSPSSSSTGSSPKGAVVNKVKTERSAGTTEALFKTRSEKDDLKKIRGIGPVLEKTLNTLGITSYQQIAEFTEEDIDKVSEALDTFPGRIERDDWIGGAKKQHARKYGKNTA